MRPRTSRSCRRPNPPVHRPRLAVPRDPRCGHRPARLGSARPARLDDGAHPPRGLRSGRAPSSRAVRSTTPTARPAASQCVVGLAEPAASAEQGLAVGGLAFRIAALRECFEEAGILLAYDAETRRPVEHDQPLADAQIVNAGGLAFADLLRDAGARAARPRPTPVLALAHTNRRAASLQHLVLIRACARRRRRRARRRRARGVGMVRPAGRARRERRRRDRSHLSTEMSLRALAQYQRSQDLFADLDASSAAAPTVLRACCPRGTANGSRCPPTPTVPPVSGRSRFPRSPTAPSARPLPAKRACSRGRDDPRSPERAVAADPPRRREQSELDDRPRTNSYLVGIDEVAVIDPGPDVAKHVKSIIGATMHDRAEVGVAHAHASRPLAGG